MGPKNLCMLVCVALLSLASCDSYRPTSKSDRPPFAGSVLVFRVGDDITGLEYEMVAKINYLKDSPGGVNNWIATVSDLIAKKGANGIINCTTGQDYSFWSIGVVGPRVKGEAVVFKDYQSALKKNHRRTGDIDQPSTPTPQKSSTAERLANLDSLLAAGHITQEEYKAKREEILRDL